MVAQKGAVLLYSIAHRLIDLIAFDASYMHVQPHRLECTSDSHPISSIGTTSLLSKKRWPALSCRTVAGKAAHLVEARADKYNDMNMRTGKMTMYIRLKNYLFPNMCRWYSGLGLGLKTSSLGFESVPVLFLCG